MVWVHPKMAKLALYIIGTLVGVSSLWPYLTTYLSKGVFSCHHPWVSPSFNLDTGVVKEEVIAI
jgi:hypothetical protein